jgi:RNA polymerase sigma factor (sigma-70 family)
MRDREIVAAIVAGDPAGLAAAYDSYAAALHAYCRSVLAEPADAADAVQDTFVIAAAKVGSLRDPDRLRPWLYAVARNECYRRFRGRAQLASLDEAGDVSDTLTDASAGAGRVELRDLVAAALAGLNPGDREVIALNLRHEVEGQDLADALGVPLNQAHALASRARGQLERSLGALLVARTGRQACADLDAMLAGWDGTLTILLRKRVSRHIENCEICGERKKRELSPAALFSVLPVVVLPPSLRHQVLRLVSDNSAEAVGYRTQVVSRAGRFSPSGFPVQLHPADPSRNRRIRAHPVLYAAAVVVILLAGGGSAAYALKHKHTAADSHPAGVTVTITVPPKSPAITRQRTPTPSATSPSPTVAPVVVTTSSPSPSTSVSPGILELSSDIVHVPDPVPSLYEPPFTATLTLTAQGGPVSFAIAVPSSEQPYLTLTPDSGTLQAGQQQVVTVTVTPAPSPAPAPVYYDTVTVNPGNIGVTIYYTPAG